MLKYSIVCLAVLAMFLSSTPIIQAESIQDISRRNRNTVLNNSRVPKPAQLSYNDAYDKAINENRILVIWVNLYKPSEEARLPEMVHCHVDSYKEVVRYGIVLGRHRNGIFERLDVDKSQLNAQGIKNSLSQVAIPATISAASPVSMFTATFPAAVPASPYMPSVFSAMTETIASPRMASGSC